MTSRPTVTVVVPVLDEESHIEGCLSAIDAQTYDVLEVLIVDGGSTDRTVEFARAHRLVRVVPNPARIQAAALNLGIQEAKGDVIVRVDGHCEIATDYVERCVGALMTSGAAMVGGGIHPTADGWLHGGIAAAMRSRFGAGTARFHTGGEPGWVDTVYLGAYWTAKARAVGGYRDDMVANEDAELAHRLQDEGGVWFDPSIRSRYEPRASLRALARQFYRYGLYRAVTVRRHPDSLARRHLAAPALVIGLASPWRRRVVAAYLALLAVQAARVARDDGDVAAGFTLAVPVMHVTWGLGFLRGLVRPPRPKRA